MFATASAVVAAAALALIAPDPVTGSAPADFIKDLTSRAVELARAIAPKARLSDGSQLPTATPEDRRRFAIPAELEAQTVRRGMLTGQLLYCDGDGINRSFLPYMGKLRASGRYSERQIAFVGVLHGVSQQMIMDSMASAKAQVCSEAFLAKLGAAAESDPVRTP